MKVLSVNVGLPRKVLFNGQIITTAIFKDPVKGPIMLRKINLDGDKQADLTVHGGVDKAVYSYPSEHYNYWRKQYPNIDIRSLAQLEAIHTIHLDFVPFSIDDYSLFYSLPDLLLYLIFYRTFLICF
jgi:hypothetical protein